jgi:hypothetical protein
MPNGRPWSPCCHPSGRRPAARTTTTARWCKRWCGWPAPARLGGTCRASTGSWKTVASRFDRWRRDGLFERLLADVHRRADACGELDWLVHYVEGSVVGAHQHAAGARHQPAREDLKSGPPLTVVLGGVGRAGVPGGWWPTRATATQPSGPSCAGVASPR